MISFYLLVALVTFAIVVAAMRSGFDRKGSEVAWTLGFGLAWPLFWSAIIGMAINDFRPGAR
jgi:hypothetical protein